MFNEQKSVHSKVVTAATKAALERRGVTIEAIAEIVFELQYRIIKGLKWLTVLNLLKVYYANGELQHAILVGIELDELAEQGKLSAPLQQIVESDEGLFGVDETIALGAVFTYGSIAVTTFGHLDKNKTGIIQELDTKAGGGIHTFLDDLVASIAACAASRIAHRTRDLEEAGETFEDITPDETMPETKIKGAQI